VSPEKVISGGLIRKLARGRLQIGCVFRERVWLKASVSISLPKSWGVESKAILAKCRDEGLGEKVPNHMSVLSLGLAETVREWFQRRRRRRGGRHRRRNRSARRGGRQAQAPARPDQEGIESGEDDTSSDATGPSHADEAAEHEVTTEVVAEAPAEPTPVPAIQETPPAKPAAPVQTPVAPVIVAEVPPAPPAPAMHVAPPVRHHAPAPAHPVHQPTTAAAAATVAPVAPIAAAHAAPVAPPVAHKPSAGDQGRPPVSRPDDYAQQPSRDRPGYRRGARRLPRLPSL